MTHASPPPRRRRRRVTQDLGSTPSPRASQFDAVERDQPRYEQHAQPARSEFDRTEILRTIARRRPAADHSDATAFIPTVQDPEDLWNEPAYDPEPYAPPLDDEDEPVPQLGLTDFRRAAPGLVLLAVLTSITAGGLSWALDTLMSKLVPQTYEALPDTTHMLAAAFAMSAVLIFIVCFYGLHKLTDLRCVNFYTGLIWICLLGFVGWALLQGWGLIAIPYAAAGLATLAGASYVPVLALKHLPKQ